ncbi:MAG TPA: hypothetical protein VGM60_04905 [Pseudonocardia sp.]
MFADYLHDLLPEHQDALCAALVEPAVGWTPGKLANRLRRMILEHDPAGPPGATGPRAANAASPPTSTKPAP